jgi:hypothetical protein
LQMLQPPRACRSFRRLLLVAVEEGIAHQVSLHLQVYNSN